MKEIGERWRVDDRDESILWQTFVESDKIIINNNSRFDVASKPSRSRDLNIENNFDSTISLSLLNNKKKKKNFTFFVNYKT